MAPKVKHQVFISSTYLDLQNERREAMRAVLKLNCIPAGMELFPAADEDSWSMIRRVIDDCDYYIVIIGGRYGSVMPDGVSFTEKEYDYAAGRKIPILAFLPKVMLASDESAEVREKLLAFQARIKKGKNPEYWATPSGLRAEVASSLATAREQHAAVGWVRGDSTLEADRKISLLRRENEALTDQLRAIQFTPPPGDEDIERGKEKVSVKFSYVTGTRKFGFFVKNNSWSAEEIFTLNEIFRRVSPRMIDGISESDLKMLVDDLICERREDEELEYHGKDDWEVDCFCVKGDSFDTVKLRLCDSGWIIRIRPGDDGDPVWKLTPLGRHAMLRVRAPNKRGKRKAGA